MCPWPRIQAALTDEYALNVTYRYDRGEPRGSVKKARRCARRASRPATASTATSASHVCPTGVDIRDGANLGCIQCGLCIDACDAVMAKIGRPARLIAYDTDLNIKRRQEGKPPIYKHRARRARSLCRDHRDRRRRDAVHAGDAAAARASASSTTATRCSCGCPTARSAMAITVRILNKSLEPRSFELDRRWPAGLDLKFVGDTVDQRPMPLIAVGPDQTREVRALVTTHAPLPPQLRSR